MGEAGTAATQNPPEVPVPFQFSYSNERAICPAELIQHGQVEEEDRIESRKWGGGALLGGCRGSISGGSRQAVSSFAYNVELQKLKFILHGRGPFCSRKKPTYSTRFFPTYILPGNIQACK